MLVQWITRLRATRLHLNAIIFGVMVWSIGFSAVFIAMDGCLKSMILGTVLGALATGLTAFASAADETGHQADQNGNHHKNAEHYY